MKGLKYLQKALTDKAFLEYQDNNGNYGAGSLVEKYKYYLIESGKIKVSNLLKDKKFVKKHLNSIERVKEEYCDYLADYECELAPDPKSKTNYIGIELECFNELERYGLFSDIADLGLEDMIQPGDDGSIEPDFGLDCELRILLKEKQLSSGLKKVNKLLKKSKFGVNDSCGLHIHLDMRNRDVEKCYKRLLAFQDVLFAMVEKDRRNNDYCKFTTKENQKVRHVAINKEAYLIHKTIEVRLHHGTLNTKSIEKWIKLLLRIIEDPSVPPELTKKEVVKWGRKKKLGKYIEDNFDEGWIKEKDYDYGDAL